MCIYVAVCKKMILQIEKRLNMKHYVQRRRRLVIGRKADHEMVCIVVVWLVILILLH